LNENRFLNNESMKLGHGSVNGFLEPQCIQSRGNTQQHIERWMEESQRDICLGVYLNE